MYVFDVHPVAHALCRPGFENMASRVTINASPRLVVLAVGLY